MRKSSLLRQEQAPVVLTDRLESGIMPLINLVFLLLMFFLIAGVIAQDQLPELPGNNAASRQEEPRVDFTIDATGQLMQKGQPVNLQRLPELIRERENNQSNGDHGTTGKKEARWRIGADQNLSMAALEDVLAAFNRAGIAQVQLLTEPAP